LQSAFVKHCGGSSFDGFQGGRGQPVGAAQRQKIENSLGTVRLWVAKRRHNGLTDGLGIAALR